LSASQVVLPIVSIPYISRVLNPDGVGRVSFIDSFTYYFISIAEFGIMVYGMRAIARVRDNAAERSKLVSELLALHVISSAFSLVLYTVAVYFLWHKIQDTRLLLFSVLFLLVNFFACEWYFIGMEKFRYITVRSLLVRVLALIAMFLLVRSPPDYYMYYGIIVIAAIIISIWNNIILFSELKVSFKGVDWRRHIRFTKITYFLSLAYGVTLLLDNVLLRMVSSVEAVGWYAFSMKVVRLSSTLLTDSLLVFFPRIVFLIEQKDDRAVQDVLLQNLRLITLLSIPLCAGIFVLAEELVLVIFGEQFLPAVADVRILSIFPFLRAYNLFLSKQILIAHNQEARYLRSLVTGGLLFVPLTLTLSYFYADKGASYAMVISEVVILAMNYFYVRQTLPQLKVFDGTSIYQAMVGCLLFLPAAYVVNRLSGNDHLLVLLIAIPLCVILYFFMQAYIIRNTFVLFLKRAVFP
jgi:O-antigen/teichoic acid export membrane protein